MKSKYTKIIIGILLGLTLGLAMISCSGNTWAKKYGGSTTIDLPKGTKLESATWKDEEIWYLYRDRRPGELAETHTLHEQSKYGLVEGKVIFKEQ